MKIHLYHIDNLNELVAKILLFLKVKTENKCESPCFGENIIQNKQQ
jgi:hypothetical protein